VDFVCVGEKVMVTDGVCVCVWDWEAVTLGVCVWDAVCVCVWLGLWV
jgi:hypothetical protein